MLMEHMLSCDVSISKRPYGKKLLGTVRLGRKQTSTLYSTTPAPEELLPVVDLGLVAGQRAGAGAVLWAHVASDCL